MSEATEKNESFLTSLRHFNDARSLIQLAGAYWTRRIRQEPQGQGRRLLFIGFGLY